MKKWIRNEGWSVEDCDARDGSTRPNPPNPPSPLHRSIANVGCNWSVAHEAAIERQSHVWRWRWSGRVGRVGGRCERHAPVCSTRRTRRTWQSCCCRVVPRRGGILISGSGRGLIPGSGWGLKTGSGWGLISGRGWGLIPGSTRGLSALWRVTVCNGRCALGFGRHRKVQQAFAANDGELIYLQQHTKLDSGGTGKTHRPPSHLRASVPSNSGNQPYRNIRHRQGSASTWTPTK